eukprot:4966162-Amphidinium_carterae.1
MVLGFGGWCGGREFTIQTGSLLFVAGPSREAFRPLCAEPASGRVCSAVRPNPKNHYNPNTNYLIHSSER